MKKYINADELYDNLCRHNGMTYYDKRDEDLVLSAILDARSENVRPVKYAHWIEEREDCFWIHEVNYKCSNCNQYAGNCGSFFPYCPHCGAEMKKEG